MKAKRRSAFAFLKDSSDVAVRIMSSPFRLLIRSSLRFSHWAVSKIAVACLIKVSMNFPFIVFAAIIVYLFGKVINDNLRASRAQSQTQFDLCRGAAVNADVSPNLPMLDRSSGGAGVRHAA